MDLQVESQEQVEKYGKEDIADYVKGFRKSSSYRKWYHEFYNGKNIKPEVTESYKRQVFENSEKGLTAMYEYSLDQEPFTYIPEHYPESVRKSVQDYIDITQKWRQALNISQEEFAHYDQMRSLLHTTAGNEMYKHGLVGSSRQGKFMAHLVLVGMGLNKLAPQMSSVRYAQTMASHR